jgi:hypothetical protein
VTVKLSNRKFLVHLIALSSIFTFNDLCLAQVHEISEYGSTNSLEQVKSVSQLRDVSPTDWSYEALRSLVERYGCIIGYPDRTFRGNRALSRYEFAAGLNACMQQIERLIAENTAVLKEDLETLKRLAKEFETELVALGTRVDNLEGRVAFLEDHQFSTTTQLKGEVIISPSAAFGSATKADSDQPLDDQITLSYRTRLNLYSSFSGKDQLKIRLESGNFIRLSDATGTDMARLSHDSNTDNDIELKDVVYRFPLGKNIRTWIGGNSFSTKDMSNLHNPLLDSSASGSLSRFHYRNPAVFRNGANQGLGFNIEFNDIVDLELAYFTGNAENPRQGNGLFNGDYTAFSQLNLEPTDNFGLGLAVAYSYYPSSEVNFSGSTGSEFAKRPFGRVPTGGLRLGIQGNWQVTDNIALAGWGGYVNAQAKGGIDENNTADIWNWSANIAFLDLAKEGDMLAIAGGMPPKATYIEGGTSDKDTSYTIEALYRYPINDNIAITPGFYVVLNPNHNADNDTIWVGTIRTTFKF